MATQANRIIEYLYDASVFGRYFQDLGGGVYYDQCQSAAGPSLSLFFQTIGKEA